MSKPTISPVALRASSRVLLALVAASVVVPLVFSRWHADLFAAPKTSLLMALGALLIGLLVWQKPRGGALRLPYSLESLLTALFFALALLAYISSADRGVSLLGTYNQREGLLVLLSYGVFYLAGANVSWSAENLRRYCRFLVDAASVAAAYGIAQFLGLDFIAWPRGGFELWRGFATLGNPVMLGVFLVLVLPLSLSPTFTRAAGSRPRWLAVTQSALIVSGIIATFTRGAWLAAAVICVAFIWRSRRRSTAVKVGAKVWLLPILAVVGVVLAGVVVRGLGARVISVMSWGAILQSGRLDLWRAAAKMIAARPWLGWGPDTYALVGRRYFSTFLATTGGIANNPHNYFLHLAATLGVPAALAFTVLLLLTVRHAFALASDKRAAAPELWQALGMSLVGFAIVILVDVTQPWVTFLFWLFAGMVSGASAPAFSGSTKASVFWQVASRTVVAVTLTLTAVLLLYGSGSTLSADYYAFAAVNSDNFHDAAADYRRAVELAPGVVVYDISECRAWQQKALFQKTAAGFSEALTRLHSAETAHPLEPDLYALEARTLIAAGQVDTAYYKSAAVALAKLERLYPNSLGGHYLRATLALKQGHKLTAAREVRAALKISPEGTGMPRQLRKLPNVRY